MENVLMIPMYLISCPILSHYYLVIDTGGIIFDDSNDIFADRITEQALVALKGCNRISLLALKF